MTTPNAKPRAGEHTIEDASADFLRWYETIKGEFDIAPRRHNLLHVGRAAWLAWQTAKAHAEYAFAAQLRAERDALAAQNKEIVGLLLHGYMTHAFLGARRYDSSADNDPIVIKARAILAKHGR